MKGVRYDDSPPSRRDAHPGCPRWWLLWVRDGDMGATYPARVWADLVLTIEGTTDAEARAAAIAAAGHDPADPKWDERV